MSGFTNYMENIALNTLFRGEAVTHSTLYVGLLTSDPGEDGDTTGEVTGASYARQEIVFEDPDTVGSGQSYNNADITFPVALENWGTITYVAVFDALTDGNMLVYAPLDYSREVRLADQYQIPSAYYLLNIK
jgi:hypothetical protein